MDEQQEVDWAKVRGLSAVGLGLAIVPWLLGLATKRQIERDERDRNRVRWTDANRWEKD